MTGPRRPVDGRITPDMANFIQLDELNGRLGGIADMLRAQIPAGRSFTRVLQVTETPQRVGFRAVSYTLYNDGAGTVYTDPQGPQVETAEAIAAGLGAGESESVQLGQPVTVEFWIAAPAGETATVRIRGTA